MVAFSEMNGRTYRNSHGKDGLQVNQKGSQIIGKYTTGEVSK